MSVPVPLMGDVRKYRPEWDPTYIVPYERIDSERINAERENRMWGVEFLARKAHVGKPQVTMALSGKPLPSSAKRRHRGLWVDVLYRIAKALDLELTDIVKPVTPPQSEWTRHSTGGGTEVWRSPQ